MAVGKPKLEINFKQKATTLIERSERGYAILVMRDDTSSAFNYKEYTDITEVEKDKELYTDENYQYIKDAFNFGTYKVIVVKIGTDEENTITDALKIIEKKTDTGWITICDGKEGEYQTLATWTKEKEKQKKTYKSVVYKVNTADCKHIVNFYNEKVTFVDSRGEVEGSKYLPSLVGILARCNVEKGCTYFKCTNLSSVEGFDDDDSELEKGHFILFNDKDYVRIAADVNSLVTLDGLNNTEDMRYIETVEAMDLIVDDVRDEFKNTYLGNYKNKYDDQILFISAVNGFFKDLSDEDILDLEYENVASINTEKQRKAWISSGKAEAATWDDTKVKRTTYKRNIYLAGDIKILGSMVNLEFDISLF